jgi:hypothetical protein
MALRRPLDLKVSRMTPVVFRLLGLLFLICGVTWLAATRYELLLPGGIGTENAKRSAIRANRGQNFVETVALTDRALAWAPLDWQLYFLRAQGKIGRKWRSDAVDDFRRARYLEPNAVDLPFQEGIVWMPTRPILAVTAWREALRRAGPQRAELYAAMLRKAKDYPTVIRGLERVSPRQPDLILVFLEGAEGDEVWSLLLLMSRSEEVAEQSIRAEDVALLAKHTFAVAQAFHSYYQKPAYSLLYPKDAGEMVDGGDERCPGHAASAER